MNNWVDISQENLAWNYQALAAEVGDATEVLAVVKANAYGHGAELCAVALAQAGARWLGVTCAEEGARVRTAMLRNGCGAEVMVMCGLLPEDVATMQAHALTAVIWTAKQVEWLRRTPGAKVHLEIDTGMGRQGVRPGEELAALLQLAVHAELKIDGVLTHFSSAEVAGSAVTQLQQRLFAESIAQVRAAGLRPSWVHAGNTSAVDNPAQDRPWLEQLAATLGARAMVRTGLGLFGYCLPIEGYATAHVRPKLRPVLTWKAHVLAVRELAVGETVGYNATFRAQRPMRIALLPVGYADGLRRELSSATGVGGWVTIRGQRAPILGRISMNLTTVDVTDLEQVNVGDEAVVLGPGITAEDHAQLAGTIAYEILCGVHPCG